MPRKSNRWTPVQTMMREQNLSQEEVRQKLAAGELEMKYDDDGVALARVSIPVRESTLEDVAARVGALEVALQGMRMTKVAVDHLGHVPDSDRGIMQRAVADLRAMARRGGPSSLDEVQLLIERADSIGPSLLAEIVLDDAVARTSAKSVFTAAVETVRNSDPVDGSSREHLLSRCRHWLVAVHYATVACEANQGLLEQEHVPFGAAPLERSVIRGWLRAARPESTGRRRGAQ